MVQRVYKTIWFWRKFKIWTLMNKIINQSIEYHIPRHIWMYWWHVLCSAFQSLKITPNLYHHIAKANTKQYDSGASWAPSWIANDESSNYVHVYGSADEHLCQAGFTRACSRGMCFATWAYGASNVTLHSARLPLRRIHVRVIICVWYHVDFK